METSRRPAGSSGRRKFTDEFKSDMVALVLEEGRSIADVARSLGIVEQALGNWVRQARIDRGEKEGLTSDERTELTQLRREVRQLSMERELLKRSPVFWVQESTR